MIKRLLISALILTGLFASYFVSFAQSVSLNMISGEVIKFKYSEKPVIKFSESELIVDAGLQSMSFPVDIVRSIVNDKENSGHNDVGIESSVFKQEKDCLIFQAQSSDLNISIYTADAVLVEYFNVSHGETLNLGTGNLSPGVYIVSINGISFKISIR
ncbi:MAG: hypothetical protein NC102_05825 [Clostridium sp.]|nr:hypothetical protein [Clostridium sp.]